MPAQCSLLPTEAVSCIRADPTEVKTPGGKTEIHPPKAGGLETEEDEEEEVVEVEEDCIQSARCCCQSYSTKANGVAARGPKVLQRKSRQSSLRFTGSNSPYSGANNPTNTPRGTFFPDEVEVEEEVEEEELGCGEGEELVAKSSRDIS